MWTLIKIVIPKVKSSWVNLAYSMGYSVSAVRAFEGDGRSLDEQCRKLFEDWLTTGHSCILLRLGKHFLITSNKLMILQLQWKRLRRK